MIVRKRRSASRTGKRPQPPPRLERRPPARRPARSRTGARTLSRRSRSSPSLPGRRNTLSRRAASRHLRRAMPLVALLVIACLGWAVVAHVRGDTEKCDPYCGIAPGPPIPPADADFADAVGWRLRFSQEAWGLPAVQERNRIEWQLNDGARMGFDGFGPETASSAVDICMQERGRRADGFSDVYEIPFASLDDAPGVGHVMQRVIQKPGKAPRAERFIVICVRAGSVGLAAWAIGPQSQPGSPSLHPDPAQSDAAKDLAEVAVGIEFMDSSGVPMSR